jgi:hypothetical protein
MKDDARKSAETLRGVSRALQKVALQLERWANGLGNSEQPRMPFEVLERAASGVLDPELIEVLRQAAEVL